MLSTPSQLLLRHAARLADARVLLVNWPGDGIAGQLPAVATLEILATNFHDYSRHQQAAAAKIHFGIELPQRQFDFLIIYASKEKQLNRFLTDQARGRLKRTGSVWVIGENRAGAKSTGRWLNEYFDQVEKTDSARHCTKFRASNPNIEPSNEAFDVARWWRQSTLAINGTELQLDSLPGVFNAGELDPGTELLLQNLPADKVDCALDFGCGCGVIGSYLLVTGRAKMVDSIDISALALASAEQTLRANGLTGRLIAGDSLQAASRGYDLIVSNPPFHRGVSNDWSDTERFLRNTPNHLLADGQLIIVANSFLPYGSILRDVFNDVTELANDGKYKVYRAAEPATR